jgi:hypothetical protein
MDRPTQDVAATEDWMVPGIILAVTEHRRRIASLLDRLDELRRRAVEAGVAALEDGTIDAATLLVCFSEQLRVSDGQLGQVVEELQLQRRTADVRHPTSSESST